MCGYAAGSPGVAVRPLPPAPPAYRFRLAEEAQAGHAAAPAHPRAPRDAMGDAVWAAKDGAKRNQTCWPPVRERYIKMGRAQSREARYRTLCFRFDTNRASAGVVPFLIGRDP